MKRLMTVIILFSILFIPAANAVSVGGGLTLPGNEAVWYYETALSLAEDVWDMATDTAYLQYQLLGAVDAEEISVQAEVISGLRKDSPSRMFSLNGAPRGALRRMFDDSGLSGAALDKHINLRLQDIRRTGFMQQEYVMQGISVYSEAIAYHIMPEDFQPRLIMLDYGEAIIAVQFMETADNIVMAAATLTVTGDGVTIESIMAEIAATGLYNEPVEINAE